MQKFGTEVKTENKIVEGGVEVKVMKASSLPLGVTKVRFYPLSPMFYEGADAFTLVQYVHWLNRRPCVCRQSSYDYSVPDTQEKQHIDTTCVICSDKFSWFKEATKLGYSPKTGAVNSDEAIRAHDIGLELMPKIAASSIVSIVKPNGDIEPPVILRYGKELLAQLERYAFRVLNLDDEGKPRGPHLCDPVKGYLFEITVGENKGGFRTYKDSMAMDFTGVDITGASWKWDEVCMAIKTEIMRVLSPDELHDFYLKNYGGDSEVEQAFTHPAFRPAPKTDQGQSNFIPPKAGEGTGNFVPPGVETVSEEVFLPPDKTATPLKVESLFSCNSQVEGGSGYELNDPNCKSCQQAKGCYESTNKVAVDVPKVEVKEGESFSTGSSVQEKLAALNKKIEAK